MDSRLEQKWTKRRNSVRVNILISLCDSQGFGKADWFSEGPHVVPTLNKHEHQQQTKTGGNLAEKA